MNSTGGCDTAVTITITEDSLIPLAVSDSYCFGDSVQVYGVWYTSAGTYQDTLLSSTGGCDTAVTITISEEPLIPLAVSDSYCYGDSVQVYGIWYSSAGSYQDTVMSTTGGCDTAVTITISEDPLIPSSVSDSYCPGDSVQVYGEWYNTAGTYQDTVMSTTGGCDTAVTITISELSNPTEVISADICTGGSVDINGTIYTAPGNYQDTIVGGAANGCDSILDITIGTLPDITTPVSADICPGGSVDINGTIYTAPGNYQDTIVGGAVNGCDSILDITIGTLPDITTPVSADICPGGSVDINGTIYTAPGNYQDTIFGGAVNGCDSILLDITIGTLPDITTPVSADICGGGSVNINGTIYTVPGSYVDTIFGGAANGCDSILDITIGTLPNITTPVSADICDGGSVDINGTIYTVPGNYQDTIFGGAANGCDSILDITIGTLPNVTTPVSADICDGGSIDINGTIYTAPGNYQDTIFGGAANGCDSILDITIGTLPNVTTPVSADICDGGSIDINGTIYTAPGNYQDTIFGGAANGCDSILDITIGTLPNVTTPVSADICDGGSVDINGTIYTAPGNYQDTIIGGAANGCDSILDITIGTLPNVTTPVSADICDGGSVDINGTIYTAPGNYQDTIIGGAANGCDSILDITIGTLPNVTTPVSADICDGGSIDINGTIYTAPGNYQDTIIAGAANGCDSILDITIGTLPNVTTPVSADICDGGSVDINGTIYTAPGNYQDTIIGGAANGCDSILDITIGTLPNVTTPVSADICAGGSVDINGTIYTTPGNYQDTIIGGAANGCDSILDITIGTLPDVTTPLNETICNGGSIDINGTIYTAAGNYLDTIPGGAANGCDSILDITITEINGVTELISADICNGGSVDINGTIYTSPGNYLDTIAGGAANGCDSILDITIGTLPDVTTPVSADICNGGSIDINGTIYTIPGNYQDTIIGGAANGCDSILDITIGTLPDVTTPVSETICSGGSIDINGTIYTAAGNYLDTIFGGAANGCDSILDITITEIGGVTELVSADICNGGSIDINGTIYTAPGNYLDTIFGGAANGCDSILDITIGTLPDVTTPVSETICSGGSIDINGTIYTAAGNYLDTIFGGAANGCDSILDITITEIGGVTELVSADICNGGSIDINGTIYTAPGNYLDTIFGGAANGCDSILDITIGTLPDVTTPVSETICSGGSIDINGTLYTTAGNYLDTIFGGAANGCDSILDITITEIGGVTELVSADICNGGSIDINGTIYTAPGNYLDTIFGGAANGCDSILDITIGTLPDVTTPVSETICSGGSIDINGTLYTAAGNYLDTIFGGAANGCDSILDITITEIGGVTELVSADICNGGSIDINGTIYTAPGNYLDTIFGGAANGCDSILDITIGTLPDVTTPVSETICSGGSIDINGTIYTAAGNYLDTIIGGAANGCDSILDITITEIGGVTELVSADICNGGSIDINGTIYTAPGNYLDTIFGGAANGCDSILDITIGTLPDVTTPVSETICSGGSIDINGTLYTAAGSYLDTIFGGAANGCDSILDITITEIGGVTELVSADICNGGSIDINGTIYTAPGNYLDTIFGGAANGCDSILDITIGTLPDVTTPVSETICSGGSIDINGTIYTAAGNYLDTIFGGAANGCDSILDITITEVGGVTELVNADICNGGSIDINGTIYTAPGNYLDTIFGGAANGCDSILDITIGTLPDVTTPVSESICTGGSVDINGTIYTAAGNYVDTIFGGAVNGCDSILDITITEVSGVTEIINEGLCEGATIDINGTIYTTPGSYMDTIFGGAASGCDSILDITITPLLNSTEVINEAICSGSSININGTDYNSAGNYLDTIYGGAVNGCDSILDITITITTVDAAIDPAGPFCAEDGVQTLTASPAGGVWSGDVSSDQFDPSLGGGSYTVIYTVDQGGCSSADTLVINVGQVLLSCSQLQPSVNDDGIGSVIITGGTPDYTIDWSGPSSGTDNSSSDGEYQITGLPAGVYSVTVTDGQGCTAECSFEILLSGCDLAIDTIIVTPAPCPGTDGTIEIRPIDGTPPYMYSTDGVNFVSDSILNLPSGMHTVWVQDANDCIVSQNVEITSGPGPTLLLIDVTNPSCGQDNGTILVRGSNGQEPYLYSIDGTNYTPVEFFTGLAEGIQTIYLEDAAGCRDTIEVDLMSEDGPVINGIEVTPATCGQEDGTIMIDATGGTGTLLYSYDGGVTFITSSTIDTFAGFYDIVVKDENGCLAFGSANVTDEGGPQINDIITSPTGCGTNTGSLEIDATGGTDPLMYSINGVDFFASNIFTGLGAGPVTVTVRDANNCTVSLNVTINTDSGPIIDDIVVEHTTCGEDDGTLEIIVSGGLPPYQYDIGVDANSTGYFDELPAGVYTVTVTDANDCSAIEIVEIEDSEGPRLDLFVRPERCDLNNGSIEADGQEGTPPYQYSFNGGPFTSTTFWGNLTEDIYEVTIRDAAGCTLTIFQYVGNATPNLDTVLATPAQCGEATGSLEILANHSLDLEYSIDCVNYFDQNVFGNLPPGNYTVCVRFRAYPECVVQANVEIPDSPAPQIDDVLITDASCEADNGIIEIVASGGTGIITYSIDGVNFNASNVFTGLAGGNYPIVVQDGLGCTDSTNAIVSTPSQDTVVVDTLICDGDIVTFYGQDLSTPGSHVIIIDVPSPECDSVLIVNLSTEICCMDTVVNIVDTTCFNTIYDFYGQQLTATGMYSHTFPDGAANGCDSIIELDLYVRPEVQVPLFGEICIGEVFVVGLDSFSAGGTHNIVYQDGNGCDSTVVLNLTVHSLPTVSAGADQEIQCGGDVTIGGVNNGLSLLWTGPGIDNTNDTIENPVVLVPGTYVVQGTNANGCTSTDTVVVTSVGVIPTVEASVDSMISCVVESAEISVIGVGDNLEFTWTGPGIHSGNEHDATIEVIDDGLYIVIATDTVTGCVSLPDTVEVLNIAVDVIAIIEDPQSLTCYSTIVDLNGSDSQPNTNLVYIWQDRDGNIISSDPVISVDSGGMYLFTVLDTLSGCFDNDTVFVEDLMVYPPIEAGDDQDLFCEPDYVTLNEGGQIGLDSIIVYWMGPVGGFLTDTTQPEVDVELPGWYYLFAMDTTNGCENYDSVQVFDLTIPPIAEAGADQNKTCVEDIIMLSAEGSSTDPGIQYSWSGPGVNNVESFAIEVVDSGTYYLSVFNETTGCEALDSVNVGFGDLFTGAAVTPQAAACEGDASGSITVSDEVGGAEPFEYSIGGIDFQSSPIFDGLITGTYTVVVRDANGCEWQVDVFVPDGGAFDIDIGPDLRLKLGDSAQVHALVLPNQNAIDSIVWTPADIISCDTCFDPFILGIFNTQVVATIYAGEGCVASDALSVYVDKRTDIYVPNAFSPTGDGVNERVTVYAGDAVTRVVEFEIFDRWGEKVFSNKDFLPNDEDMGWDGRFRGERMQPGVFVYRAAVELIDGSVLQFSGDITLVR